MSLIMTALFYSHSLAFHATARKCFLDVILRMFTRRLFATLDPALRRVHLPSGREAILSDTVGFISDLPHQLVNAFKVSLLAGAHNDHAGWTHIAFVHYA